MSAKTTRPGQWVSSVSADLVAGKVLRFGGLGAHNDRVFWVEARPQENGRSVLVSWSQTQGYVDLVPEPYSVRSKVHEYGGGAFFAGQSGVFFVDDASQDVFRAVPPSAPERITQAEHLRFADFSEDSARLIAVCEDHAGAGLPQNSLVAIGLEGAARGDISTLQRGHDFYAFPRVSLSGDKLAFLAWDLPYMPWEAAALYVCDLKSDGSASAPRLIAGGVGTSVFQPVWAADDRLYFVAEAGDQALLHVWDGVDISVVVDHEGDFSRPLWGLGTTSYALLGKDKIAASFMAQGRVQLGMVDVNEQVLTPLELDVAEMQNISAGTDFLAALVATDHQAPAVTIYPIEGDGLGTPKILRPSAAFDLDPADISHGAPVQFEGVDGGMVHALYYAPTNGKYELPADMKPPAIVSAHGGPTGFADRGLKLKIQYWTSRGFAYLDVDYRGSAGYGKAYREALGGQWGVLDVADVISGAQWLKDQGLADPEKLIISGSSAGGYTVLQALVASDVFAAGAAYYGISDLAKLAEHTHKFEAGYVYTLLGVEPENASGVFAERSPIHHADQISSPVIFLQGADDKVVPPEQSRLMAQSLKQRGIPVCYVEYDGEGHGFRKPEHVRHALEVELAFYNQILQLGCAESLPAIEIENFKG